MTQIKVIEPDVRMIVSAITKAVSEDVPNHKGDHPMEFTNYLPIYRDDCIKENLREMAWRDGVEALIFMRNTWKGCLLIDKTNMITYTVTTHQNLLLIPRKQRSNPHFLQSVFGVQNKGVQGQYVQMELFPMDKFEQEELEQDYNKIVNGFIDPNDGYKHYVIAYTCDRFEVTKVDVELYDGKFNLVEKVSLDEFIKPDFAKINETVVPENTVEITANTDMEKPSVTFKNDGFVKLKTDLEEKEA